MVWCAGRARGSCQLLGSLMICAIRHQSAALLVSLPMRCPNMASTGLAWYAYVLEPCVRAHSCNFLPALMWTAACAGCCATHT